MSKPGAGIGLGAFLVLTAIALIGGTAWNLRSVEVPTSVAMPTDAALSPGVMAPDFRLARFSGDSLSLAQTRGKVVVIAFWSTWSDPSQQQLSELGRLSATYPDAAVEFLALNLDRDADSARRLVEDLDPRLTVLQASVSEQVRYRVSTVPTLYILDREGRIQHRHAGLLPGMRQILRRQIDNLLSR